MKGGNETLKGSRRLGVAEKAKKQFSFWLAEMAKHDRAQAALAAEVVDGDDDDDTPLVNLLPSSSSSSSSSGSSSSSTSSRSPPRTWRWR